MALSKAQIAAMMISAAALSGGGYAVSQMGQAGAQADGLTDQSTSVAADETVLESAPVGQTALEASANNEDNPYAPLAARASVHGAVIAHQNLDQRCSALFNVLSNLRDASREQQMNAAHSCMDIVKDEAFHLAQATLAQFSSDGNMARLDAAGAAEIYTQGQEICAPVSGEINAYFSEYDGQSVRAMIGRFKEDITRCLTYLSDIDNPQSITDNDLSQRFQDAVMPVNQEWLQVISAYNNYMNDAIAQGNPNAAIENFARSLQ